MHTPPQPTAWHRYQTEHRSRPPDPEVAALAQVSENARAQFNLDPAQITLAAELAAFAPGLQVDERRALTLLVVAAQIDLDQGSTRTALDRGHLGRIFLRLCAPLGDGAPLDASAELERALSLLDDPRLAGVVGDESARVPLVRSGAWLYTQRMLHAEARLAERLRDRIQARIWAPPSAAVDAALTDLTARPAWRGASPVTLSDEQLGAVRAVVERPLTLVSGGPGTGKTSIVVAVLRALVRLGLSPEDVALAAPTGKAAWRMGSAVKAGLAGVREPAPADEALLAAPPAPRTLHRLLGYSPRRDRFRHQVNNPLSERVVVVDESSMIDLYLMERLVGALRPETRLILLGDADQLPSVAAGAVFRDVLAAAPGVASRLTVSYRMRADDPAGRSVLSVARRVNRGQSNLRGLTDDGTPLVRARASLDEVKWAGVEQLEPDPERFGRLLDRWFGERVRGDAELRAAVERTWRLDREGQVVDPDALDALFRFNQRARLLCVTRAWATGTIELNARMHARMAVARSEPVTVPFLVGEPVMVLRNDYERGLFNGDQGVVLWFAEGGQRTPRAVFPRAEGDGYRAFRVEALAGRLEHCYAMTVHKAQGSEYDVVALVLPERELPLLTRELLYTAITRSRRGVLLLGSEAILRRAVSVTVERRSGLPERIRGADDA